MSSFIGVLHDARVAVFGLADATDSDLRFTPGVTGLSATLTRRELKYATNKLSMTCACECGSGVGLSVRVKG